MYTYLQLKRQSGTWESAYERAADNVADRVAGMPEAPAPHTIRDFGTDGPDLGSGRLGIGDGRHVDGQPALGGGEPLADSVRAYFEPRFGCDFSRVRVHSDDAAADAAASLRANAFAAGRHIVFGHGKFAPGEGRGRRLLAHELAHVVQQRTMAVPAGLVQRDPDTEAEVKAVISPNVELRKQAATEVGAQLDQRMQKRKDEITASLGELGDNPKTASARRRAEALKKDLAKDLDTVLNEPDSRFVSSALRKDIVESARRVKTQKLKLKSAEAQWAKYDPIFAGQEVAKALGKDSLTAAELKALIAQESGDLTKTDQKGNIAGIAQMGAEEEKKSGGKPGDRKIPEKAIVLAAKTMARIGGELDAALSPVPGGADHKMFIMAAYNAGNNCIITAQKEAIKAGKDGKTWQSLIDGGTKSALHKAIEQTYQASKVESKFKETSQYVTKILARLPGAQP
jgi:hypothetical protein